MNIKKLVIIALAAMLLCAGCGETKEKEATPGVSIDKDGAIQSVLVESFEEAYYDLTELQDMVTEELKNYNQSAGRECISAEAPYLEDNRVVLKMTFDSYNDYNDFNERDMFLGTLDEAAYAGYKLHVAMKSVTDPTTILTDEKMATFETEKLLVVDEPGTYYLPGKPLYISEGVEVVEKKAVYVSEEMEGIAYIIYK